jgi:hypothetical protein
MSEQRKQLIKVVETLASKQDAFVKAVDSYDKLTKELIWDLDRDLELKKEELEKLNKNYENQLTDGKIQLEHDLKMYEYDTVVEILKKKNQMPFSELEINELKKQLTELKESSITELKKAIAIEKANAENKLNSAIENITLKHTAETAQLKAEVGQRSSEILVLQNSVKNLQSELAEQRNLTRDVASSSRQAPITQSFGGKN